MQIGGKVLQPKTDTSLVIPVLVLSIGLVFLAFDVFVSQGLPTAKSIALIAGSLGYLGLRKRLHPEPAVSPLAASPTGIPRFFIASNILFLAIFGYILYLITSAEAYSVPTNYFIAAAAICVIIVVDILLMKEINQPYRNLTLIKIIAVSLMLITVPHYFFPSIGQDFWEHSSLVNSVLALGHIPEAGFPYYQDFMGMHFVVAAVKAVTKLEINSSMMTIGVFQITSLLSLFCVGREITKSTRAGLLGALIAGISGPFLFWGYYVIPMTLGIGLVPVLLLLIVKSFTATNRVPLMLLWLAVSILMVYTHTIAGLIFLIAIVAMFAADQFLHFSSRQRLPTNLQFSTPLWFFFALIGYWVYISRYWFREFGRIISNAFSLPAFEAIGLASDATPNLLGEIGFTALLSLAVLASLFCWRYRRQYRHALLLTAAVIGLVITLFASGLLGRSEFLLPDRWEPFIYVTIAPLAGLGIYLLHTGSRGKALGRFGIAGLTLVIAFTMIATSLVGHANPITDKQTSYRIHWLDSEVTATTRVDQFYEGPIISDEAFSTAIRYGYGRDTADIYPLIGEGLGGGGAVIIRQHILNYPFRTAYQDKEVGGYASYGTRLDETEKRFLESLEEDSARNKIYSNGEVTIYLEP